MTKSNTDIQDADLARATLEALGASSQVEGASITANVGASEITIDLATGEVDAADDKLVAKLRQLYAEMVFRHEVGAPGGVIEAREVRQNGDIVLVCTVSG